MKLWENVTERKLRPEPNILKDQFGLCPGSQPQTIYILRQLMERQ